MIGRFRPEAKIQTRCQNCSKADVGVRPGLVPAVKRVPIHGKPRRFFNIADNIPEVCWARVLL